MQTKDILMKDFLGTYYQILQTPNSFQKTGLSTATYYRGRDGIRLINKEYSMVNGKAVVNKFIEGSLYYTNIDPGTFFVNFDNIFNVGLYRVLEFEKVPKLGTYILVSSFSPSYTWLLWKPPLDKSNILKAYEYALSKLFWFDKLDIKRENIIVVKPTHLYEMLEYNH